jgi:hypothetical protein
MQIATEHNELSDDEVRVREWRREQFRQLGFDGLDVELLADSQHVDLGDVRRLLARGCRHDVLLRIVL